MTYRIFRNQAPARSQSPLRQGARQGRAHLPRREMPVQAAMKEAEELVRQALGVIMKAYQPTTESIYDTAEFAVRRLTAFLGEQADLMDLHPDLSITLVYIGDHA